MRNIVYATNITIDGFCDHNYFMPDEELMVYFAQLIQDAGLLVYGRTTYELMVPYWPDVAKTRSGTQAENEFAQALTDTDKIVFSRTLEQAEGNTRIMRGNLEDEIVKLKLQAGKSISVGGVDLPSQLMALGLVDEFHFVVHPIIAGKGRRLLEDSSPPERLQLKLKGSKSFDSGVVAHHYVKA
ncbi:MAG: dihydrofolate reductase family protein [Bacteroidetes bacterium]|nr:dihydrofolate reductase family protein [Bacteroidota bacterium]